MEKEQKSPTPPDRKMELEQNPFVSVSNIPQGGAGNRARIFWFYILIILKCQGILGQSCFNSQL